MDNIHENNESNNQDGSSITTDDTTSSENNQVFVEPVETIQASSNDSSNETEIRLDPSNDNISPILESQYSPRSRTNDEAAQKATSSSSSHQQEENQFFQCNICFDQVNQPVVTLCGHLFCWPCIYRWFEQSATCPVCKAGASKDKLVPIYGRTSEGNIDRDPRNDIPERPAAMRPEPPRRPTLPGVWQHQFGTNISFSAGVFPFGFQMNWPNMNENIPMSEQQQHQAFMSRILLTLGCLVLLILILL